MVKDKKDWTERERECRDFQMKIVKLAEKMKIPELYFCTYIKDLLDETEDTLKEAFGNLQKR